MQKYFKWLPHALTLSNLLMGCVAIRFALQDNLADATIFMVIAMVFDFFDGFAARMLKVSGPLGKQLDTLADMVTFGVAPAMILYMMASDSQAHTHYDNWLWGNPVMVQYLAYSIAIASAWRLAVFNIDEGQEYGFKGLPTPANAMIVASLPWIAVNYDFPWLAQQLQNPYILILIMALCTWLPVSGIKLIALKFKNFSIADNLDKYIIILVGGLSVAFFGLGGMLPTVVIYILVSIFWPKGKTITN